MEEPSNTQTYCGIAGFPWRRYLQRGGPSPYLFIVLKQYFGKCVNNFCRDFKAGCLFSVESAVNFVRSEKQKSYLFTKVSQVAGIHRLHECSLR